MKVEISERSIMEEMKQYYKLNKTYPKDIQDALEIGRHFYNVGLTPFYIYDQTNQKFIVTSKENFDKLFN